MRPCIPGITYYICVNKRRYTSHRLIQAPNIKGEHGYAIDNSRKYWQQSGYCRSDCDGLIRSLFNGSRLGLIASNPTQGENFPLLPALGRGFIFVGRVPTDYSPLDLELPEGGQLPALGAHQ